MKHSLLPILFFIFSTIILSAQGIIVNEVSNGPTGTLDNPKEQEYIELVVIGSDAAPTDGVDLTGWVIDDNNGDFTGNQIGVGIASGHLRFTGSCFSNVAPGTIIIIYNEDDRNPSIPADDITDSNSDCIYIVPANSSCIETCSNIPNSSPSPGVATYGGCSYTTGQFINMGIANSGDAVQTRRPDFSFYHGFGFGTDIDDPGAFPNFPADLGGGSSFKIFTGSGSGRNYFFENGDFTNTDDFNRGFAPADETPGAPNNDLNRAFINALRDGTYNYSDLTANSSTATATGLSSCISLPVYLSKFEGEKVENKALLNWVVESTTSEYFTFEIERSANGYTFETIGELGGYDYERYYSFMDQNPGQENYYRLKMIDPDGSYRYSKLIHLEFEQDETNFSIFPNPVQELSVIRFDQPLQVESNIIIYNVLGAKVQEIRVAAGSNFQTINTKELPKGTYTLIWANPVKQKSLRFVK